MFAYEQCLLCLGHHPDIWVEAASFLQETAKILQEKGDVVTADSFLEQTSQLYERAISGVLNGCVLLYFSYADFEEQNMKFDKVHTIYQKFLDIKEVDPTLCYVQYLKFCRRAEGIKSARVVFKRAREDSRSNFHIYVAAALTEYYCSKDKSVAFKIFELGLKKFSNSAEFILAYLDYLSHLNEDNNTRVLFERVLTGSSITPKESVDIWNKFLEFESNIGDLASVIKVEKRRATAFEEAGLNSGDEKQTAQVIDRYRFMSLLPLSETELRSIGYQDSYKRELSTLAENTGNKSTKAAKLNGAQLVDPDSVARPDFSQMVPFKPKVNWRPGEFMVPGGEFPLPPSAAELCTVLPPPHCFKGPYVIVDKLCEIFDKIRLPDTATLNGTHPHSTNLFDLAKSVQWIVGDESSRKRKPAARKDDSDDDSNISAPTNDLYRKRQQKN